MRNYLLAGVSLVAMGIGGAANAADTLPPVGKTFCDPYKNYACMDSYLGQDFMTRFINYYRLEWGHEAAPSDPKAAASRRDGWPATPQSIPPMPFTEWPYGGATAIGVTRPNSVDSPLMNAMSNTAVGQWMNDAHIQVYGWVNAGGNLSNNTVRGGNSPAAYDYNPNTVQLDQAVVYIERLPDTVQKDHIDWGFRIAPIYGENYRYTTAYGLWSNQLLQQNRNYGYDMPMAYGEVFIPYLADGLLLRFGRYISIPDIEAQLAPNNYMYTHSMTYTFDNYTNTGINASLALNKNWMIQGGFSVGTEAMPWHVGAKIANANPNPLFPDSTMLKDPGAQPTFSAAVRYVTDSGNDGVYVIANGINNGTWGYNNLQWYGLTYYHKFNDQMAHLVRDLQRAPEQRAQPRQSGLGRARGQRYTVLARRHALERTVRRALRQRNPALVHGVGPDLPDLRELQPDEDGQHLLSSRVVRRQAGTAYRREDALCRNGDRLAALVLAADRDPARSVGVSRAGRAGVQR